METDGCKGTEIADGDCQDAKIFHGYPLEGTSQQGTVLEKHTDRLLIYVNHSNGEFLNKFSVIQMP